MGEIVNLRRVRKAKARDVEVAQAAENRARNGQTKAEKIAAKIEQKVADKILDAARIERD